MKNMKNEGGKMSAEVLMLLAAFIIAIVGIYKYATSEDNDYNKAATAFKTCQGDVAAVKKVNEKLETRLDEQDVKLDRLEDLVTKFTTLTEEAMKDVDSAQDHMAKLRDGQMRLKSMEMPNNLQLQLVTPSKPIEISIIDRTPVKKRKRVTRSTTKKTRAGTSTRSETRVSRIKGDPDKPPRLKKARKKKAAPAKKKKKKKTKKKVPKSAKKNLRKVKKQLEVFS